METMETLDAYAAITETTIMLVCGLADAAAGLLAMLGSQNPCRAAGDLWLSNNSDWILLSWKQILLCQVKCAKVNSQNSESLTRFHGNEDATFQANKYGQARRSLPSGGQAPSWVFTPKYLYMITDHIMIIIKVWLLFVLYSRALCMKVFWVSLSL